MSAWTYRIELWSTAFTSNIEILELFQSKVLRMIVNAFWYVTNTVNRGDFQTPSVKEEIRHYYSQYSAPRRPSSESYCATRQQVNAKIHAKGSAYHLLSLTVLFVV
jgi:hypothetical protein